MPIEVKCSLEHYMDLVLHNRLYPYCIITKGDDIWNTITSVPESERQAYILENEEYTIGFNNEPMSLAAIPNGYRLWHRKDWELCDNRRKEAVSRITIKQREYKAKYDMMREAVRVDMLGKGVTAVVWNMLSAGMNDSQVEMMFNNIKKV